MPFFVRHSGAWEEIEAGGFSVRHGGVWETVQNAWVRHNGAWELFYENLAVSLAGTSAGHTRIRITENCHAGVFLGNNGTEYAVGADGTATETDLGPWLDAGSNTQVWVRCTVNSGVLDINSDADDVWLALTSSRRFSVLDTTEGETPVTADLTIELAADSGGVQIIDSEEYFISANNQSLGGG